MAQKAKSEGRGGIDRWTSNGVGLNVIKTPITKAQAKEIDKSANKKRGK